MTKLRILVLTQEEHVYLPRSFQTICEQLGDRVQCIVISPAMSTHGGPLKGLLRHIALFGPIGTFGMVKRVVRARTCDVASRLVTLGNSYSISAVARRLKIPVYEVNKINSPELHAIVDRYAPDLLISVSCPQIIGKKVRARFSRGCVNVHGAPLPKYRGLMPAFWALKNGERTTAVTVHDLADRLDNGDILLQREVPITDEDTWDSLVRRSKEIGASALVEAVLQIEAGTATRRENKDDDATYYSFPTGKDRREFQERGRRFF